MESRPSRKRHLEVLLEEVPSFPEPKEELEQYKTPASLAAEMCWRPLVEEGLSPRLVLDLGCGTGTLCYAALLLGAPYCVCLDLDPSALAAGRGFMQSKGLGGRVDFVVADIGSYPLREKIGGSLVLMNPPWGTRKRRADRAFLIAATEVGEALVSVHPRPRRLEGSYVSRILASRRWRVSMVRETLLPLRAFLPHHVKRVHRTKAVVVEAQRGDEQGRPGVPL